MPNYEYIFTSFSSEKFSGRHTVITTLLNMNIVKHELESMDTNISKVWRIINLFLLQIKETWDFNKPSTQLAHRLLILVLFDSRFFIVSFKLIMINWPKSSLSKKKRKVQHNSVIYTVIFLPNHQFCSRRREHGELGKKDVRDAVDRNLLVLLNSMTLLSICIIQCNPIVHLSCSVHHIEKQNCQEALDFA